MLKLNGFLNICIRMTQIVAGRSQSLTSISNTFRMSSFQDLTPKLLSKIFDYLSFAEISEIRGVSINLHQAARQRLNSTFLELGPRLMTKYTQYLISAKTDDTSCKSGDSIFRGRFLRLLVSEHAILLALCRNYITNGKGCFSPGEILDLFLDLQKNNYLTVIQHEENKKLARLVLLIDQYVDWFERFRIASENQCSWYGTCIVDLLDSYLSSSYNLVATHDGPLVKLTGRYVMKGQSEIPPKISEPLGGPITQKELLQILQYIRKHVRWSNFIKSFRNDSEKVAELEEDSEEIVTNNNEEGYQRIYKRNQSGTSDYDENAESLIVMVNLQCDRREGPARLRGGFVEMNEWEKQIEIFKRDMKESQPRFEKNSSRVSKNDTTNKLVDPKKAQLRSPKESTKINTPKGPMHEKYIFNLELKSIYPSVTATSGEKFGETMLHVSHTPEHIFAAQTECSLY